MEKIMEIDLSDERLLAIAEDAVEQHNYILALKMLNKNADLHFNDADSLSLYAEIFDDMGLYERCINSWFRFIDYAGDADFSDAYEGLAISYMNIGNEHFSAYYYNKLLVDNGEIDSETRGEIIQSFLSRDENPLKFVYPPEIADCSDVIAEGIEKMKCGEYDKAVETFGSIEERNPDYLAARNYIAMCDIITDKCDEAEQECLAVLKRFPDNVQALTTLAAVKTEQKKSDEGRKLAEKLLSLDVTATDDMYKIATVCCENKLHEEAYGLFCKIENELPYDSSLLYFKAVSAFNCGKYEESLAAFDKLVTIYPDAVTAAYYYRAARDAIENGKTEELSYFYRLPAKERENSLQILAAFSKLSKTQCKKLSDVMDISECIRWCFDESEGRGASELQFLAAECAVKAELDGIVCNLLLNAFLSDSLKIQILTMIGERNEPNSFGVVICHIYKTVDFYPVNIGRLKRKSFVAAYSRLNAHFGILDNDYCAKFATACETLYREMEEGERLAAAADTDALTAAMFYKTGITEAGITRRNLSAFFDTSEAKIKKILGEI